MKTYFTRRESIIMSAIEIIDELGINELSLREIGNRQGISDSALYKHFSNKEELILAVLDYYSRFDTSIMQTIEESNLKSKEAIIFFIKCITEIYENQPSIVSLAHGFEVLKSEDAPGNKAKEIFIKRSDFLNETIKKGQMDGSITSDINSEDLADFILGYIRNLLLKWSIFKYKFPLKERALSGVTDILNKF